MLLGKIVKICKFKKILLTDESKNLLFDYCFFNFFPFHRIFKNLVYICLRLILVVIKNTSSTAEILAHEVGKYEKVTVD